MLQSIRPPSVITQSLVSTTRFDEWSYHGSQRCIWRPRQRRYTRRSLFCPAEQPFQQLPATTDLSSCRRRYGPTHCPVLSIHLVHFGRSSLLLGRPRSSSSSASAVSSGVGDEIGDLGERIGNPNPSSLDPMCLTFRALRMTEMALASERTIRTLGSARLLLRLRPCPCPCPCSGERDRSFRVEPALLVPELVLLGARLPARDGTRERAREGALLRPVSSSDDE
jgi:hypothetical protein